MYLARGYDKTGVAVLGIDGSIAYRLSRYSTVEKKILQKKWNKQVTVVKCYMFDEANMYDEKKHKFVQAYKIRA